MIPGIESVVTARFDDVLAGTSLVFPPPERTVVAHRSDEVLPLLQAVDGATMDGAWAYGFLSYEAAAGLDAGMSITPTDARVPLAWFSIGAAPRRERVIEKRSGERPYWCSAWTLTATAEQHTAAVAHAQREIVAGNIYQANITCRARATVRGDLGALYSDLVHAQQGSHNALLDFGDVAVLSVSPELFFDWSPPRLWCRPMKGTARRDGTGAEDERAAARLSTSAKDIAENVMIVDLVRNDLGRIARTGSVHVPRLFTCEPFGSVWQLSSDVVCEPRADVGLHDILTALFPSGSVTGAPKGAAIRVIRDLEAEPRGVYCGAIGWVAPPSNRTRARFNVAIRTLVIDRNDGAAVYGSGGGITAASVPSGEFDELLDKIAVLSAAGDLHTLELIETLAFERSTGFRHVDRHLDRLARSAAFFGFRFDADRIRHEMQLAVGQLKHARLRLRLGADGEVAATVAPLPMAIHRPVRLAIDTVAVAPDSLWQQHKTNRRDTYDAAVVRHPDADDVVLINTYGHITETTIANIAVCIDNEWWTPPAESGCLPGIGRAVALDRGVVKERTVTVEDLRRCRAIALMSSLRGWRPATLVAADRRLADTRSYSTGSDE